MYVPVSPEVIKFTPIPLPEISGSDERAWPMVFERILAGPDPENKLPSYGGFHFIGGGKEAFDSISKHMQCLGVVAIGEGKFTNAYSSLHRDEGTNSAATALFQQTGSVEMLLFYARQIFSSTYYDQVFPASDKEDFAPEKLKQLFSENVLPLFCGVTPLVVLGAVVDEGDTVLFDHRHHHAIHSLSKERISLANYIE